MLGVNYYTRHVVSGPTGGATERPVQGSCWPGSEQVLFSDRGLPVTAMGWEIDANGLHEVLTRVATDYPTIPLYITENGAAFADALDADGVVHDPQRVRYLEDHLRVCADAVRSGVPLGGYFAWSLFDNFEWAWGYSRRFGLVYVDYPTQRRIPKSSAYWYAESIRRWRSAGVSTF
jgi:beta-glucosidase